MGYNFVIVGTGAVGEEMVKCLKQSKIRSQVENLKILATSTRMQKIAGEEYIVQKIKPEEFEGVNIALFAGTEGEKGAAIQYAAEAIKRGCIVIDNGADYRMDKKVPLVIPEINLEDLKWHTGLIANPNCSTIIMLMALAPIYRKAIIKRIIVSTYQAVSGTGTEAIKELIEQSLAVLRGEEKIIPAVYPIQIAFNLFPHIGTFKEYDFTTEEWKMIKETHKILNNDSISITATTVRVPVLNGHSESIYIETEVIISPTEVRELLKKSPGVCVIDDPNPTPSDPNQRTYPTPFFDASGVNTIFVGRIRKDPSIPNGLHLWVVGDNLRKGAALNAVQIAEELISQNLVKL
jgi:aspartate-semialdehyde dehydrogenase